VRYKGGQDGSRETAATSEFWIPYSDLMAGLLGVFAMLLIATLYSMGERVASVRQILDDRRAVAERLTESFANDGRVDVNAETGAIRFSGDVLFDTDSAKLSDEGQRTLSEVMPRYLVELFGDRAICEQLDQIIIEGHADSSYNRVIMLRLGGIAGEDAAYNYNLELSQKRALSVMQFLLDEPDLGEFRDRLKEYATANGRSYVEPVLAADGACDFDRSRRIEIKFTLRDQELLERILRAVYGDDRQRDETHVAS